MMMMKKSIMCRIRFLTILIFHHHQNFLKERIIGKTVFLMTMANFHFFEGRTESRFFLMGSKNILDPLRKIDDNFQEGIIGKTFSRRNHWEVEFLRFHFEKKK